MEENTFSPQTFLGLFWMVHAIHSTIQMLVKKKTMPLTRPAPDHALGAARRDAMPPNILVNNWCGRSYPHSAPEYLEKATGLGAKCKLLPKLGNATCMLTANSKLMTSTTAQMAHNFHCPTTARRNNDCNTVSFRSENERKLRA